MFWCVLVCIQPKVPFRDGEVGMEVENSRRFQKWEKIKMERKWKENIGRVAVKSSNTKLVTWLAGSWPASCGPDSIPRIGSLVWSGLK